MGKPAIGCDNGILSGSSEPTMVWFHDLVGVGIGPVSKKLAVKISASTAGDVTKN